MPLSDGPVEQFSFVTTDEFMSRAGDFASRSSDEEEVEHIRREPVTEVDGGCESMRPRRREGRRDIGIDALAKMSVSGR